MHRRLNEPLLKTSVEAIMAFLAQSTNRPAKKTIRPLAIMVSLLLDLSLCQRWCTEPRFIISLPSVAYCMSCPNWLILDEDWISRAVLLSCEAYGTQWTIVESCRTSVPCVLSSSTELRRCFHSDLQSKQSFKTFAFNFLEKRTTGSQALSISAARISNTTTTILNFLGFAYFTSFRVCR